MGGGVTVISMWGVVLRKVEAKRYCEATSLAGQAPNLNPASICEEVPTAKQQILVSATLAVQG